MGKYLQLSDILTAFKTLDPFYLGTAVISIFISLVFLAYRWILIIKGMGANNASGIGSALGAISLGLLCGLVLPSRAGYYIKAMILKKLDGIPYKDGLSAVNVETLCDMGYMVIMTPVGLIVATSFFFNEFLYCILFIILVSFLIAIVLIRYNILSVIYRQISKFRFCNNTVISKLVCNIVTLIDSTHDLIKVNGLLRWSSIITLLTQIFGVIGIYLLLLATDKPVSFLYTFFALTISYSIGIVSLLPSGLGSADLSLVFLLKLSGVGLADAASVVILWRFIPYAIAALVACIFLIKNGKKINGLKIEDFNDHKDTIH